MPKLKRGNVTLILKTTGVMMIFTNLEKKRSLNYLDIPGLHLQLDDNDCCHIKESFLSRLSIDELPLGKKFIFMDEPKFDSSEAVSVQMAVEHLGDELILRVQETGNRENWKSDEYMEMYFASRTRKLETRQQGNFDVIICNDEKSRIGYCLMANYTEVKDILRLSDIVYKTIKESVYNFNRE